MIIISAIPQTVTTKRFVMHFLDVSAFIDAMKYVSGCQGEHLEIESINEALLFFEEKFLMTNACFITEENYNFHKSHWYDSIKELAKNIGWQD